MVRYDLFPEEIGFLKAGLKLAIERLESSREKNQDDFQLIENLRKLLDDKN